MQQEQLPLPGAPSLIKYLNLALATTWFGVVLLIAALQLQFGLDAPYRFLGFEFIHAFVMSLNLVVAVPMIVLTLWGISRSERTRGRRLRWYFSAMLFGPLAVIAFWLGEK